MQTDPVPDEYCPHIQEDHTQMVGGWYFAARVPPIAVGMCRDCLDWCHDNLSQPQTWSDFQQQQQEADDLILNAKWIR